MDKFVRVSDIDSALNSFISLYSKYSLLCSIDYPLYTDDDISVNDLFISIFDLFKSLDSEFSEIFEEFYKILND